MPIPAAILALIQAGRIAAPLAARTMAGTGAAGLQKVQRGGKTFWRKMGSDEPWITNPKPPQRLKSELLYPVPVKIDVILKADILNNSDL